jgi:hypothetical protein
MPKEFTFQDFRNSNDLREWLSIGRFSLKRGNALGQIAYEVQATIGRLTDAERRLWLKGQHKQLHASINFSSETYADVVEFCLEIENERPGFLDFGARTGFADSYWSYQLIQRHVAELTEGRPEKYV